MDSPRARATPRRRLPFTSGFSQNLSEFALHARAILGLPVPDIEQRGPSASSVLLVQGDSNQMRYRGLDQALAQPETEVRLFGKPEVKGSRRLGVALARGESMCVS